MKANANRYRYPFTPYPWGWYRIGTLSKWIDGASQRVTACGKNFTLVVQAQEKITLKDAERSFPTTVRHGDIFFYYESLGKEPVYQIPYVPEFENSAWYSPFELNWRCRVHIQEIAENALDLSHFSSVHTYRTIPTLSKFVTEDHCFNVFMHSKRKVLGFLADTTMDISYHGLGIVVSDVTASGDISLKVFLNTTPVDDENVAIHMKVAVKKTRNPIKDQVVRWIFPSEIWNEFHRDLPVWESKIYRSNPTLCAGERNIIKVRKWAQQFYSSHL